MNRIFILWILLIWGCASEGDPTMISSGGDAESVYFTRNEDNEPVIAWTERKNEQINFLFAVSKDGGKTFGHATNVPVPREMSTHAEGMPKVAFKRNGSIIAAYETKAPTKDNKYAGAIFYIQSYDNGNTWSAAKYLHNDTISGRSRSFFDIETLPNGEVGAAWLDIKLRRKEGGRSVRFAKTSEGAGFENEILVDSSACECCRMELESMRSGGVALAYRGMMGGSMGQSIRDIMFVHSADNGASFSKPERISEDNWAIDGCPHTGPSMHGERGVHALWYSEGGSTGIFYSFAENTKSSFSKRESISLQGKHPQMCGAGNRVIMVWEETVGAGTESSNRIRYQLREGQASNSGYITPDGSDAFFPVATEGKDNFIIAYLAPHNGTTAVFLRRVEK